MDSQDSPFGGLDKLLLSPARPKKLKPEKSTDDSATKKQSSGRGVDALFSDPSPTPLQTNSESHQKNTSVPNGQTERSNRTVKANGQSERSNRTVKANGRTERLNRSVKANDKSERNNRTDIFANKDTSTKKNLILELQEGSASQNKRATERYSFEIYSDQRRGIEDLQYQYKRRTDKKLSASRIIREALSDYLAKAGSAIKEH